jgi:predicted DNA-binding ribbon-helix-helix protein
MVGAHTRNVMICGRRTSIRLEAPFWSALRQIIGKEDITFNALVSRIDAENPDHNNLSNAVRVFIHSYFFALARQRVLAFPPEHECPAIN